MEPYKYSVFGRKVRGEYMKYIHWVGLATSVAIAATGCAGTSTVASLDEPQAPYPEMKSREWCQDNYSSAAVSARDRQANAKHCDELARRNYMEAKRERESRQ